MREFDFWQRWGLGLDDTQFANAFMVLGLLAAAPGAGAEPAIEAFRKRLNSALKGGPEKRTVLTWRFPTARKLVRAGDRLVSLADLTPGDLAALWAGQGFMWDLPLIVRVVSRPSTSSVTPWFRTLCETQPSARAVYVAHDEEGVQPHLKWPFRVGYLGGDSGEEIVKTAAQRWPTNRLTVPVRIDRDNANCDILVFGGSARELTRALLDMPGRQRCNLVIARGGVEDGAESTGQRLAAVAGETSASGYIFVHTDAPDDEIRDALNDFITNLSHNQPVDGADHLSESRLGLLPHRAIRRKHGGSAAGSATQRGSDGQ